MVVTGNKREETEHKAKNYIYLNCCSADPKAVSGSDLFIN